MDTDGKSAYTDSVSVMEATIEVLKERIKVSIDLDVSVSSYSTINPALPKENRIK